MLDIDLPDIGGLEVTRRLLRRDRNIKIIILTAFINDVFPRRLMQMGVSGYLTKDANIEQLMTAIIQVYEGKKYISPLIANQTALQSVSNKVKATLDKLSIRELELMILIAKGDKVKDLSEKLHLSAKTINGYCRRIFRKLGINNRSDMTHLALQFGLIQPEISFDREIDLDSED